MFAQGTFLQTSQDTPETLARKRAAIAAMMPRYGSAKYIGEGLGQLFHGIGSGMAERKMDKTEADGRQGATDGFARLFGGPMTMLGVNPDYGQEQPQQSAAAAPADQNSPYQIGQDARSALSLPAGNVDFAALEEQYGLPAGYLDQTYQIESGGNPNAQNPNSSAGGGFQFIDSTAAAYGLKDKTDLGASADAAARFAADNKAQLVRALGREPTAGELYLAHQQGGGGASALLADPNALAVDIVGADAVRLNGGNSNMTAGEFAGKWTGKFGGNPAANTALPGVETDQIMAMLANPWLAPEQREMLTTMLDSQMQAGDPMRQIELQKSQLELAQMQNPQADPMAEIEMQQAQLNLDQDRAGGGADVPKTLTERKALAAEAGLQPGTPEYQGYIATGQLSAPGGGTEYGLQMVLGRDKDGNPVVMQLGKDGTAVQTQMPDGVTPDIGLLEAEKAAGTAEGKALGEDTALLASLSSKLPGLETVVSELEVLADNATYTRAGKAKNYIGAQFGFEPQEAAIARAEYIAKVDNQVLPMLRDTFGSAFTVKEGDTLRATLGDPDKTPPEKKAVLRAFIEQQKRNLEGLATRTGAQPATVAAPENDADYLKSLGLE